MLLTYTFRTEYSEKVIFSKQKLQLQIVQTGQTIRLTLGVFAGHCHLK